MQRRNKAALDYLCVVFSSRILFFPNADRGVITISSWFWDFRRFSVPLKKAFYCVCDIAAASWLILKLCVKAAIVSYQEIHEMGIYMMWYLTLNYDCVNAAICISFLHFSSLILQALCTQYDKSSRVETFYGTYI